MLADVNKFFVFKCLLTTPSNVLPFHLKQTFPSIIWIFTEGDGIESRLPFKIFSTLKASTYIFLGKVYYLKFIKKIWRKRNILRTGNNAEECQNYIKVLQQYENDPDRYLICGTNAYKPSCRIYVDERGSYVMREPFNGLGLAPFRYVIQKCVKCRVLFLFRGKLWLLVINLINPSCRKSRKLIKR